MEERQCVRTEGKKGPNPCAGCNENCPMTAIIAEEKIPWWVWAVGAALMVGAAFLAKWVLGFIL